MSAAVADLLAALAAVDDSADSLDPLELPKLATAAAKAEILTARRARFVDEARAVVSRADAERRAELNPNEALLTQRLLDYVAAIDVELPRWTEVAEADRQTAETLRNYGITD
jgi:hypothetical protein